MTHRIGQGGLMTVSPRCEGIAGSSLKTFCTQGPFPIALDANPQSDQFPIFSQTDIRLASWDEILGNICNYTPLS